MCCPRLSSLPVPGGEKSFTTVSFILALGEITENPFRAMDEFDVFMDSVNRRISMQSLIKFAYQLNHVQFLFLTPQVRNCLPVPG